MFCCTTVLLVKHKDVNFENALIILKRNCLITYGWKFLKNTSLVVKQNSLNITTLEVH